MILCYGANALCSTINKCSFTHILIVCSFVCTHTVNVYLIKGLPNKCYMSHSKMNVH